jgi:hypothetical protein
VTTEAAHPREHRDAGRSGLFRHILRKYATLSNSDGFGPCLQAERSARSADKGAPITASLHQRVLQWASGVPLHLRRPHHQCKPNELCEGFLPYLHLFELPKEYENVFTVRFVRSR